MKLRWYQYSLRSLMLLVLLVAIFMSWFAVKMKQARVQRTIVVELLKTNAAIGYNYLHDELGNPTKRADTFVPYWLENILGRDFFENVTTIIFEEPNDRDLDYLNSLTHVQSIYVFYPNNITDEGLKNISSITALKKLDLCGRHLDASKITDAGLKYLWNIRDLRSLNLSFNHITDVGSEYFDNLTQLRSLYLNGTKITDAGLKHIKGLTKLQNLELHQTAITDAGLEYLKGSTKLQELFLPIQVSSSGIADLQKALPNTKITR
jgi:hypothetical protein